MSAGHQDHTAGVDPVVAGKSNQSELSLEKDNGPDLLA